MKTIKMITLRHLSRSVVLVGVLLWAPLRAQSEDMVRQALRRPDTKITFGVSSPTPGLAMNGDLTGYSGLLALNSRGLEHSSLELTLNLQSARLSPDQVLQAVFLQTALARVREPKPTFRSSAIRRNGNNSLLVDGAFTWEGKVRKATVPLQLVRSSPALTELRLLFDGTMKGHQVPPELSGLGASTASGWAQATLIFARIQ